VSAVEVFRFPETGQEIRTAMVDGTPCLVAADLCNALGLQNARRTVERIDADEVRQAYVIDSMGRDQLAYVVTEAGMYELVLRSDKPEARRFRKWVTATVLPAIRKTGHYESPTLVPALPDMTTPEGQLQVAEMLLESARERVVQAREIEAQRAQLDWAVPRAQYTDRHVDGAHDATTVRDFAKQADVGEKKLREWMTARRLIYKDATNQWKPYAQLGPRRHWFVLKDQPDAPRLHNGQMRTTLYITPAGKVGIADLLAKYPLEEAAS
jgi:prophage antirepressor-like protein